MGGGIRYGAARITDELHEDGEICSKNRVARRMRHVGLRAKARKKFKVTTDSKHNLPVAPNLLNRDFTAVHPIRNGAVIYRMCGQMRDGCIWQL